MTDSVAAAYSSTGGAWARGPARIYQRLATVLVGCSRVPFAGRSVVDVGAGTGAGGRAALDAKAASVVAVDAALGMLLHAARDRPPAVAADALALPFRDRSFGAAIAAFSLNHLSEPACGLREIARVLTPGGPIVAGAYAADDTHPVKHAVEQALARRGWAPEPWYKELRRTATPLLATRVGFERAAAIAGLDAMVREIRVDFGDLGARELIEWRLGMAQHAPFVATLAPADREAIVGDVLNELGRAPEPLVRSIVVLAAVAG